MKKEENNYWKELARDFIALGGLPFFVLVLVRVWMLDKPSYFSQFVVAGILFFIVMFVFKFFDGEISIYSGLGLVMLVFTALYYGDLRFSIFALWIYIGLMISLFTRGDGVKKVWLGSMFGGFSSWVSYMLVQNIF